MPQNHGNNGNIYDLRRDLQHPSAPSQPSQQSGTPAGSADSRYGFNGEPLSFKPERTASGTVRRTRTDNSIEFPAQPRMTQPGTSQRSRSQNTGRSAQRTGAGQAASGQERQAAQRPKNTKKRKGQTARDQNGKNGQSAQNRQKAPASRNAQQARSPNQRLRPAQPNRDPARREKRKKRKMTRAAIKRRRMLQRLFALATLLAVIVAGIYLTVTMLFKIGTIEVETADGTVVQEVGGYTSSEILQTLGVQLEENIFGFDPKEKEAVLEKQYPLLESIQVERNYPNTVVVKVTEAVPAYAMQTKSGWLTLSDKFKILACSSIQPDGLKTLYGGEPVSAAPGDQLTFDAVQDTAASDASGAASDSAQAASAVPDGRLAALNELQTKLEEYGMLDDVTRIEFADTDEMAFLYQDRVSVLLGTLNDLDYKLDRARYVLTNADGKGCAPTDTGRLDFSHISAGSTRKIYFAQGEPTLPSGYVVPEPVEPAEDTTEDTAADSAAQPADDTEAAADELPLTDPARMTAVDEENPM